MNWRLTVCTLLGLTGFFQGTSSANCNPYQRAEESYCSSNDRHRISFEDIDTQLTDAISNEHTLKFVVNTTLGFYKFLHPCASTSEAALILFYEGQHNVPDQGSDLLLGDLQHLLRETGSDAGCVAFLINKYKATAATEFKRLYPNFRVPTKSPPTTTTHQPTTTTPKPSTPTPTTPKPTTTMPSTPSLTTIPPTNTPVVTLQNTAPVTYGPISCSNCSGLTCLIGSHLAACPDGQFFCLTTIEETDSGRQISRGCASQASCDGYNQNQDATLCSKVDHQMLASGNVCHFCCVGDNCNKPPQVTPDASTLYH